MLSRSHVSQLLYLLCSLKSLAATLPNPNYWNRTSACSITNATLSAPDPFCFSGEIQQNAVDIVICRDAIRRIRLLGDISRPWVAPRLYKFQVLPNKQCTIALGSAPGIEATTYFSATSILGTADSIFQKCDVDPTLRHGGLSFLIIAGELNHDWIVEVYGSPLSSLGGSNEPEEPGPCFPSELDATDYILAS